MGHYCHLPNPNHLPIKHVAVQLSPQAQLLIKLHVIEGGGGSNGFPVYIVVKQDVEFPQVLVSS